MPESRPQAILTLDVEDWEHANYAQLESEQARIAASVRERKYAMDANTDRWIQILAAHGATSTCFVLGEFAERYPEAVRRLAAAGHEIATHGARHDLVYLMSREQFREFLKAGIEALARITGKAPIGFRAPSWSVGAQTPWLCEELERQGIRYDSSEFPMRTPLFGQSGASLRPYRVGAVLRVPVTVLTVAGLRLPFSSGAFFRMAPLALIRVGLQRAAEQGLPAMVVLHPRELDPEHPRLPLRGWEGMIHYARLGSTIPKLEAILKSFQWRGIAEQFSAELTSS